MGVAMDDGKENKDFNRILVDGTVFRKTMDRRKSTLLLVSNLGNKNLKYVDRQKRIHQLIDKIRKEKGLKNFATKTRLLDSRNSAQNNPKTPKPQNPFNIFTD